MWYLNQLEDLTLLPCLKIFFKYFFDFFNWFNLYDLVIFYSCVIYFFSLRVIDKVDSYAFFSITGERVFVFKGNFILIIELKSEKTKVFPKGNKRHYFAVFCCKKYALISLACVCDVFFLSQSHYSMRECKL